MSEESRYRALGPRHLDELGRRAGLSPTDILAMRAVATVLPFRTNAHVVEHLVDWSDIPGDPIFQLTFPQPGMLHERDLARLVDLLAREADPELVRAEVATIRSRLNPHPGAQLTLNVPEVDGERLEGVQHKYSQTVLFFPAPGQTCHAYCTYCFRWAQFVGDPELRFRASDATRLVEYLRRHPEVTDVLITGGDPLIMPAAKLARFVEPLLAADLPQLETIRIGSKALAYWPYRLAAGEDADATLHLFERIAQAGKRLALMAHFSHPRELEPPAVSAAVRRIRDTGATIYCQAPLVRRVNDDPAVWRELWSAQARLGCVPYYMFVERDTGPHDYFKVPLAEAVEIFAAAYRDLPGLARTVRGPVMSATPGKVVVDGVLGLGGERAFALRFLQARDPQLVGRPFLARFDPQAAWLTELELLTEPDGADGRITRLPAASYTGMSTTHETLTLSRRT